MLLLTLLDWQQFEDDHFGSRSWQEKNLTVWYVLTSFDIQHVVVIVTFGEWWHWKKMKKKKMIRVRLLSFRKDQNKQSHRSANRARPCNGALNVRTFETLSGANLWPILASLKTTHTVTRPVKVVPLEKVTFNKTHLRCERRQSTSIAVFAWNSDNLHETSFSQRCLPCYSTCNLERWQF